MRIEVSEGIRYGFSLVMVCWLSNGLGLTAQPTVNIFSPPEAASILDGNSYATPFNTDGRYQQVYDSSIFLSRLPRLPDGGGFIRHLVFRVDANIGSSFIATLPNVQINLSTTGKSADGLSCNFGDNVGDDDFPVFGPSSIRLSAAAGGGLTGWDVLFHFPDRPFYYNPAKGNLLVDFRVHQGFNFPGPTLGVVLDAFTMPGDPISSVYAPRSSSLSNGQISTLGLATDFLFAPVPHLAVSLQSTNLLVTWPLLPIDFKLEQTIALGIDAVWQPAGGIIATNRPDTSGVNDTIIVTLPLEGVTGRFFRLAWQTNLSNAAGLGPDLEPVSLISVPKQER